MVNIKAIIGANYGDEGKGLMTDYFCHQAIEDGCKCLVICNNGGSQRGHTVQTPDGKRHIFHHFGSGTLVGADTYLTESYILNPIIFRKEWDELQKLGITPTVYISDYCSYFTNPFDMAINQILEEFRGENRHGSCGLGINETIHRSENFDQSDDFSYFKYIEDREHIKDYLYTIKNKYLYQRLEELGCLIHPKWIPILENPNLIDHYVEDYNFMMDHVEIWENRWKDDNIEFYDTFIYENGQGLFLDENNTEDMPHLTPSATGFDCIHDKLDVELSNFPHGEFWQSIDFDMLDWEDDDFEKEEINIEVCYVSRTYLTRHGNGNMEHECEKDEINKDMVDLTNLPNLFQGYLRYGKLDYRKLIERTNKDFCGYRDSLQKVIEDEYNQELMNCSITYSLALTHDNECPHGNISCLEDNYDRIYISDGETRESVKIHQ